MSATIKSPRSILCFFACRWLLHLRLICGWLMAQIWHKSQIKSGSEVHDVFRCGTVCFYLKVSNQMSEPVRSFRKYIVRSSGDGTGVV